jgi:hypothetical protein
MAELKQIKEVVRRNHGGLEQATDGQILTLWNALDKATQERYLKSEVKIQEAPNAIRG